MLKIQGQNQLISFFVVKWDRNYSPLDFNFNKEDKIPNKDDIISELDHLAEETAEKVVLEGVEEKTYKKEDENNA